jgi:geranylgeranyl diphosphate synthase type I
MTDLAIAPVADTAADALRAARGAVDPELRAAVDGLPGNLRHLAGYHFGWWDRDGSADAAEPGKALRPALTLLAAEAVGGSAVDALPAATAVELVHNFSLIHDDVMDGDETRRHRPTVWAVFGVGQAILAGDALLALAFDVLASADRSSGEGTRMLTGAVGELLAGQGEDLAFEGRDDVGVAQCIAMARRKTGALLECSAGLGAYFGDGSDDQLERLRGFGADIGLAFQCTDDVLGIWGDPRTTGKPVYSDLRSGKRSLPVVAALDAGEPVAAALARARDGTGPDGAALDEAYNAELAEAIDRAGGRDWCVAHANDLLERALDRLSAHPPLARSAELTAIATLVVGRDH